MDEVTKTGSYPLILGTALLGLPVIILLLSSIGLWLGLPVTGGAAPISILAMSGFIWWRIGGKYAARTALSNIAAFIIIISVCAVASGWMYDLSWDGQAYHQEAIIQLLNGWNPFRQTSLPFTVPGDGYNMWIDHYAKGLWICAASVAKLTGHIEYGKVFAPILCIASLLLAYSVLEKHLRGWEAAVLSALMTLSPVVVSQLGSFYVDGSLASTFLCTLALMYHVAAAPNPISLTALSGGLVLLSNIKFTGAVDAGILAMALISWAIVTKQPAKVRKGTMVAIAVSIAIGAIVTGYQPYMVNFRDHGHPLYPVMGTTDVDVIEKQINREFAAKNQMLKTLVSLFAFTENNQQSYPVLKWPFGISKAEIDTMAAVDVRIGGFGPWFGPIALLSLILLAWWYTVRRKGKYGHMDTGLGALTVGIVLAAITGFVNPEAWWARFSPQLWLLAPGSLAVVLAGTRDSRPKAAVWYLAVLLYINLGVSAWAVANSNLPANRLLHQQLRSLAMYTRDHPPIVATFHYFPSNRRRLTEAGIKWKEVSGLQPVSWGQLVRSDTVVIMY